MHPSYDDIIQRISTPPIWFDENAVPRYCDFAPSRSASIYICEIALAEVTCQVCQRRFDVAFSVVNVTEASIADAIRNKTLHYGDPPSHRGSDSHNDLDDCAAGSTMSSEPRRVLEYWRRNDQRYVGEDGRITSQDYFTWTRDASLEVDIEPDWVKLA